MSRTRRDFIKHLGISAAAVPFVLNLSSLAHADAKKKQRVVFLFSPNGIVPSTFCARNSSFNTKFFGN